MIHALIFPVIDIFPEVVILQISVTAVLDFGAGDVHLLGVHFQAGCENSAFQTEGDPCSSRSDSMRKIMCFFEHWNMF